MFDEEDSEAAAELPPAVERWEVSGGTWQIDGVAAGLARILLLRCDGGEVVDVIETADSETVRWAREQLRD